jgi:TonB family protein
MNSRETLTRHPLARTRRLLAVALLGVAIACSSSSGVNYTHHGPTSGKPVPVDLKCDDIEMPKLVKRVEPAYPADVRKQRIEGKVVTECIIDSDGSISDIQVRSSPSQTLSDLAVAAIRQWHYNPAYCKDLNVPLRVYMYVSVTFSL